MVLSVTTSTGYAVACDKAPAELTVIYSPVDLALVVGPVFARIQPRQFILVEAEVWPNLVRVMQRARVPVVLVNARLSPRSERRYRRFRWLVAPVFGMLDKVLVQEPEDVARWEAIGARPGTVQVTGSIKFDLLGQAASSPERVAEFRGLLAGVFGGNVPRVVLVASSHAGEEQAHRGTLAGHPGGFSGGQAVDCPPPCRAPGGSVVGGGGRRIVRNAAVGFAGGTES